MAAFHSNYVYVSSLSGYRKSLAQYVFKILALNSPTCEMEENWGIEY